MLDPKFKRVYPKKKWVELNEKQQLQYLVRQGGLHYMESEQKGKFLPSSKSFL